MNGDKKKLLTQPSEEQSIEEEQAQEAAKSERKKREEAKQAVQRVQGFDTAKMDEKLQGNATLIASVRVLVSAYLLFPLRTLDDLPIGDVEAIYGMAEKAGEELMYTTESPSGILGIGSGRDEWEESIKVRLPSVCGQLTEGIRQYTSLARAGEAVAQLEGHLRKAEQIVNTMSRLAGDRSVSAGASVFKEDADDHEKKAGYWLTLVYILVSIFGGFALLTWLFSGDVGEANPGFNLAKSLANRAVFFLALGYGVFFCGKNYMAHRHNAIVNRHRQKALQTYDVLLSADPISRSIILEHVARCIYAPQNSGYSRGGNSFESISRAPVESATRDNHAG